MELGEGESQTRGRGGGCVCVCVCVCGITFNALVIEKEFSKLRSLITIDGTNELVDSKERKGISNIPTLPLLSHLLGVVTITKHFEAEEGKGSRQSPVMGSGCSEVSNSMCS